MGGFVLETVQEEGGLGLSRQWAGGGQYETAKRGYRMLGAEIET